MTERCEKPVDVVGLLEHVEYIPGDDDRSPRVSLEKLMAARDFIDSIFPGRWYEVIPDPDFIDDDDLFDFNTFFAVCAGEVIGFVSFKNRVYNKDVSKEVKRRGIAHGNAYNIYLLGVGEKWRRAGVAETLLNSSVSTFCGRKCFFEVFTRERNAPAISLYKKLGFKEMSRAKAYYPNTGEDAIVFGMAT